MEQATMSVRSYYEQLKANPGRKKFGFGKRPAIVNVDLQRAYTAVGEYPSAYETDPRQLEYVRELSDLVRAQGLPVIWTYVAYHTTGADAGVWGTRSNTPDSLQNIKENTPRSQLDPRLQVDRERDFIFIKRMPSVFHETHLQSLLTWHQIDTLIVTGGSTSGCVRATVVDSLSRGYRTIVPEECVADRHEIPHFANLYDMLAKYADVESFATVRDHLRGRAAQ